MVIEKITSIVSDPIKAKSSYGSWVVLANTDFYSEENKNSWSYPAKHYYFWNKKSALEFINRGRSR